MFIKTKMQINRIFKFSIALLFLITFSSLGVFASHSNLANPSLTFEASEEFQQDTTEEVELISFDDVEFSSGDDEPELLSFDDVEFTSSDSMDIEEESVSEAPLEEEESFANNSLWAIFIAGFIGGFAALLMPCIFPMLPLTVSFFTKGSESKSKAIGTALLYGLSIIVIYVALGLVITVMFGADALNELSTNGVFNFVFFLLLVVFAISFLGGFELTLPSKWVNKMDQKADKGGFLGIFFMAATLAVVSFSCTGPIIGTLLVQAATMGELLGPAIGMFGFALALAIPFALFAMFPGWMKSLPSSGGWLNSVKVTLGFLELALALKFLSNVDLAYHWKLFDREVFLVLWIVIFAMLGFYLLGKLRFAHDSPVSHVSLPRLFLSIIVFSFTVYMVPGLWGAPLKAISAFLPPQHTQDFDLYTAGFGSNNQGVSSGSSYSGKKKYSEIFHAPLNMDVHFDYEEGLERAKAEGKPVLIDFTGHACVNCRQMEAAVWPDKEVYRILTQEYIVVQLYVDDKTELLPEEQYVSSFSGKKIRTIGNKWSDVQASKFNSNSQPYYVMMDPFTEEVMITPKGADYNAESYAAYLMKGVNAFKERVAAQ